jgi:hypothetical protein
MDFLEDTWIRDWCIKRGFALDPKSELIVDAAQRVLESRGYGQQVNPEGQEAEIADLCAKP